MWDGGGSCERIRRFLHAQLCFSLIVERVEESVGKVGLMDAEVDVVLFGHATMQYVALQSLLLCFGDTTLACNQEVSDLLLVVDSGRSVSAGSLAHCNFSRLCVRVHWYFCLIWAQQLGVVWQRPFGTILRSAGWLPTLRFCFQNLRCPLNAPQELNECGKVIYTRK